MTADKIRWIADGEKYALVALTVKTEGHVPEGKITPNLWVIADTKFEFPAHWREWLGTLRAGEVESANLFLLSKEPSAALGVLDAENQLLQHWVQLFYAGLLFTSRFATARKPVVLTGSRSYEGRKLRCHKNLYGVVRRAKPTMWWLGVLLLCGLILDIIVKSISTSAARPTDDLSNGTGLAGED